jgi:hypothetical protein
VGSTRENGRPVRAGRLVEPGPSGGSRGETAVERAGEPTECVAWGGHAWTARADGRPAGRAVSSRPVRGYGVQASRLWRSSVRRRARRVRARPRWTGDRPGRTADLWAGDSSSLVRGSGARARPTSSSSARRPSALPSRHAWTRLGQTGDGRAGPSCRASPRPRRRASRRDGGGLPGSGRGSEERRPGCRSGGAAVSEAPLSLLRPLCAAAARGSERQASHGLHPRRGCLTCPPPLFVPKARPSLP